MINSLHFKYFYLFSIVLSSYVIFVDLLNISEPNTYKWYIFWGLFIFISLTPIFKKYLNIFNNKSLSKNYLFIIFLLLLLYFVDSNLNFNILSIIFLLNSIFFYLYNSQNKNILNLQGISIIFFLYIFFNISVKLYYWIDYREFFWRDIVEGSDRFNIILSLFNSLSFIIPEFLNNNENKIFFFNLFFLLFFLFCLILINIIFQKSISITNVYKKFDYRWWILPVLIFFLESFSTYNFFGKVGGGAAHHWQVYITTLELMGNGGYLLWDAPSQYGFLSLLTVYLIPFDDPWMKLYFLNALLKLIASLIIFKIIWGNRNFYWYIFSILITWASCFLLSSGSNFLNSSMTPSTGPLRYIWVIVLLLFISKLKKETNTREVFIILLIWLIGFFWSLISAFNVSIIIIPYLSYIAFFSKTNLLKKIVYLSLFPISILFICFFLTAYYVLTINQIPDFIAFFDQLTYAISYNSTNFYINNEHLILFFIFSWAFIIILNVKKLNNQFALLSLIFGIFSLSFYVIDYGESPAFIKHLYLYLYLIFLIINQIKQFNFNVILFSPLLIITVIFCFANPKSILHIINTYKNQDYLLNNVNFEEHKDYNKILTIINPKEIPIVYIEPGRYGIFNFKNHYLNKESQKINTKKNYLPNFFGTTLLQRLNKERKIVYSRRWLERNEFNKAWFVNGIVNNKDIWHKEMDDVTKEVLFDYEIEKIIYFENLKAILYSK